MKGSISTVQPGSVITVVSWNIDCFRPEPAARVIACIDHIQDRFETKEMTTSSEAGNKKSEHFVIMLQEVCQDSLAAILSHEWIRTAFVASNITPPSSIYSGNGLGRLNIIQPRMKERVQWHSPDFFTLILASKNLPISSCFRIPLVSRGDRDVLAIDVPVKAKPGSQNANKQAVVNRTEANKGTIRLCTTHLESFENGKEYRPLQLAILAKVLRGKLPVSGETTPRMIGGLAGGDMNTINDFDSDLHRLPGIDLQDVWELGYAPPITNATDNCENHGQAAGTTWGYQPGPGKKKPSKKERMDRFYFTKTTPSPSLPLLATATSVPGAQDITNNLGRIGIGVKVPVQAWSREVVSMKTAGPQKSRKRHTQYIPASLHRWYSAIGLEMGYTCSELDTWASDHFGIVIGIKIEQVDVKDAVVDRTVGAMDPGDDDTEEIMAVDAMCGACGVRLVVNDSVFAQPPISVAVHEECFRLFLAGHNRGPESTDLGSVKPEVLDRLFTIGAWRQPWKDGYQLGLKADGPVSYSKAEFTAFTYTVARIGLPQLARDLPIEILEMVYQLSEDAPFWRCVSVLVLGMCAAGQKDEPLHRVPLGHIKSWKRPDLQPETVFSTALSSSEPSVAALSQLQPPMQPFVRITVDHRGICEIQRLQERPAVDTHRTTDHRMYIVEHLQECEITGFADLQVEIKDFVKFAFGAYTLDVAHAGTEEGKEGNHAAPQLDSSTAIPKLAYRHPVSLLGSHDIHGDILDIFMSSAPLYTNGGIRALGQCSPLDAGKVFRAEDSFSVDAPDLVCYRILKYGDSRDGGVVQFYGIDIAASRADEHSHEEDGWFCNKVGHGMLYFYHDRCSILVVDAEANPRVSRRRICGYRLFSVPSLLPFCPSALLPFCLSAAAVAALRAQGLDVAGIEDWTSWEHGKKEFSQRWEQSRAYSYTSIREMHPSPTAVAASVASRIGHTVGINRESSAIPSSSRAAASKMSSH
ncbi:endonuclease exonuclease phosphatase family protein [Ophiostoma piceae UAMH 11346]|uniref:Endonuclease exonuclease phosphatase family protein n=1 Tax=Ophiostoma piceae (strain UAMH 11346) TaxID=1262450 RepID=S3C1H4_OPHP1|nr:endonuclease exonuclease phosphatase family protein [Ophiostoma piceae UAMH 11346]